MSKSYHSQLSDFLSSEALVPQKQLEEYAVDGVIPQAAVRPHNRKDVADILEWASAHGISVFPRGGGTKLALGNVPQNVGVALVMNRQGRLLDYQAADLTATVEAGMTLNQLQQQLAPGGKFLPLESPLAGSSTVGGIVAANTTGPQRFSFGQPRDWLIGIKVVSATGVETKAGGKVVKNVTGYDLNKLYTGSLGTLGVIVEATFKLSPLPTRRATIIASFPGLPEGVKAGDELLRQVFAPQGVQVLDPLATRQLKFELGNAMLDRGSGDTALLIAFFTGRPRALQRRTDESSRLLRESGATDVDIPEQTGDPPLLECLTDMGWNGQTKPYLGIKITVPPSAVPEVLARCLQIVPLGLPPAVVADPSYALVQLFWWTESVGHQVTDSLVLETIARTREVVRKAGGSAVVEHCPLTLKKQIDVWGGYPQGIEIMRRVKQKFDPSGILSPGRFVGGI